MNMARFAGISDCQTPQPVPSDLGDCCARFGRALVAHYANGGSPRSRECAIDDADKNPVLQTLGKVGEVAAALYFRLDPATAIRWDVSYPDSGTDIVLPNGIRVDVKASYPPFKLIWPLTKNEFYSEKQFDVLLSVTVDDRDFSQCFIDGYITKAGFFKNKLIARPDISRLIPGTWFVDKRTLSDPRELLLAAPPDLNELFARYGGSNARMWEAWERLHDLYECIEAAA